ncbi:MAG: hypothetical protein AAGF99_17665 [Bacteroidota bacterium]
MLRTLTLAILVGVSPAALAFSGPAHADSTQTTADAASLDALIAALYDVISGPAGQDRDWDRMRALFLPEAQLIPTRNRPDGSYAHRVMSVDDYIETSGPWMLENGFFEVEVARRTEQFAATTHVWSTYEGRMTQDGEVVLRGVNSIQALWDGTRWWIVSVFWSPEHPGNELPAAYLSNEE